MAISVTVMVGDAQEWIPEIVEKTKGLSIGPGHEDKDIAPLNSKEALDRALNIINKSEQQGAKVLVDGRGAKVSGYEKGNWLGPTIIDHVKPGMECYDLEIFSPVMIICRVDTL